VFFSWQQTSKKISWGLPYLHTRPNYTGKQLLLEANKEGKTNTKYGLAIALLCEWNEGGKPTTFIDTTPIQWKTCTPELSSDPLTYYFWNKQTFICQTNKHAKRMELAFGAVITFTFMEMKNYMSYAICIQLTWRYTGRLKKSINNTT
jgi:hypothetical protein